MRHDMIYTAVVQESLYRVRGALACTSRFRGRSGDRNDAAGSRDSTPMGDRGSSDIEECNLFRSNFLFLDIMPIRWALGFTTSKMNAFNVGMKV